MTFTFNRFSFPLVFLLVLIGTEMGASQPADVEKQAEQLLIEGKRKEATSLLLKSIDESASKEETNKLKSKLKQITRYFLSEEAQKKYHYGLSYSKKDPPAALDSFEDAVKLEPGNLSLLQRKSEVELLLGLCDQALKTATSALSYNPYDKAAQVRKGQALICGRKFDDISDWLIEARTKAVPNEYLLVLEAQTHFFKGEYGKSLAIVGEVEKISKDFPEAYYWKAKILKQTNSPFKKALEAYVTLCETQGDKLQKLYSYEPRICSELETASKELQALESETL